MRIALVLERFDPTRGGLEHWTWQFAQELLRGGHEVHVFACSTAAKPEGLHFHHVTEQASPLARARAFESVLRHAQADVIHDMGGGIYADIFHPHGGSVRAWREHNLMRIPRWRQFRLWQERRYREQAAIERIQHRARKAVILAVSEMVRSHLIAYNGLHPSRMELVRNGVDAQRFHPCPHQRQTMRTSLHCDPAEFLFLMVAHNLKLKNAEAAIRALALVHTHHPVRLLVLGGKRPEPFLKLAKHLGVAAKVQFLPPVHDVRPYYNAADACLHPTWYDPCSLVGLEALACALPLLTTSFNGVTEIMGRGGLMINDPADFRSLAEIMKQILHPPLRESISQAAREAALAHSLTRQTEELLALYERVAAQRGALRT